ncbi:TPA: hypothetical protein ACH3X1_016739 [Trebouxia sp. C0004]
MLPFGAGAVGPSGCVAPFCGKLLSICCSVGFFLAMLFNISTMFAGLLAGLFVCWGSAIAAVCVAEVQFWSAVRALQLLWDVSRPTDGNVCTACLLALVASCSQDFISIALGVCCLAMFLEVVLMCLADFL